MDQYLPLIIDCALNVIFAILILIIGWMLAKWAQKKIIEYGESSERLDTTLTKLFGQIIKIAILAVVFITVLGKFGVATTSLAAIIAAVGLAIGLAWKGVLSDFAAGVMIIVMRPFKVGDAVEIAGKTVGVVDEIGLVLVKMHTFDGLAVIMPNRKIWGNKITNYSKNDTRRIDLIFGFGYDDDIDKAIATIQSVVDEEERILSEPAPVIRVNDLGASAVNLKLQAWVNRQDFGSVKNFLTKRMKERADEEELNIPYPTQDIHLITETENG